jgi:hypothetical protein
MLSHGIAFVTTKKKKFQDSEFCQKKQSGAGWIPRINQSCLQGNEVIMVASDHFLTFYPSLVQIITFRRMFPCAPLNGVLTSILSSPCVAPHFQPAREMEKAESSLASVRDGNLEEESPQDLKGNRYGC